ncbi:MAG: hypothetical protein JJE52_04100 [Acidimicrobiia bacterium]|nr:hypothetical protein [Acidimicrobiia bacterium]
MGARHRQRKADQPAFATETREMRKAHQRAERHSVHQTLHEANTDGVLDDVVLPVPKATRGRIEPAERDEVRTGGGGFKPWKQPFWKRRVNVRRARVEEMQAFAAGD